jgi:hypothetical protein
MGYGWTIACKKCGKKVALNRYKPGLRRKDGCGILFCTEAEREEYIRQHPEILEEYPLRTGHD